MKRDTQVPLSTIANDLNVEMSRVVRCAQHLGIITAYSPFTTITKPQAEALAACLLSDITDVRVAAVQAPAAGCCPTAMSEIRDEHVELSAQDRVQGEGRRVSEPPAGNLDTTDPTGRDLQVGVRPTGAIHTTTRWQAVCKECQRKGLDGTFGYPDSWARKVIDRGGARSNRCPVCRLAHGRDAALMAVPYIDVATIGSVEDTANPTGPLGGLGPLPVVHRQEEAAFADLAKYDFGLKDDDLCRLLDELKEKQVAVVIAGTGSGKSTFLPFRLLYPPHPEGRHLADRGQIIVTQPRRCAAIDIAGFVASLADPRVAGMLKDTEGEARKKAVEQLSRMGYFGVGSEIGYRVSEEHAFDANCRLVYVTDGSLLNWLRDGKLDQFGTIIIDEAHERSQNIDFILGYLRAVLPRHPRLRVIIVSATIDGAFFVNFFGGTEKVYALEVETKKLWGYGEPLWPLKSISDLLSSERAKDWQKSGPNGENLIALTQKYERLRLPEEDWQKCDTDVLSRHDRLRSWRDAMPKRIAKQIARIVEGTPSGDILAFLPTQKLIDDTYAMLAEQLEQLAATGTDQRQKVDRTSVYKLLAKAPKEEQEAARGEKVDPHSRRVILSTNIAETSLTIDGITFVVDSGLILQTEWKLESASQAFPTVFHSRDGIRQRWGRVGRKAPGWVFPLYTEDLYNALPAHTPPASLRENAEQSILKAVGCGIDDPCSFMFPAAFSTGSDDYKDSAVRFRNELKRAYEAHIQRGALDSQGDLTPLGLEIEPYCGSMSEATAIMVADQLACAIEAVTALKLLQGGSCVIGNNPKNNLLEFNRNWDADMRDRARQYLMALRAGCLDDLDLVLKIYAAWERAADDPSLGDKPEDRPRAWAEKHFVSHAVLTQAKAKRRDVLETLSFNKKTKQVRYVLPELAPRVRAAFSYALGDLVYEHCGAAQYHAINVSSEHEADDRRAAELDGCVTEPASDRVIAFRRRATSQQVALSNLVARIDWAVPDRSQPARPWSKLVREIATRLRDREGKIIGPTCEDHWALWPDYPVGAYLWCRFRQDGETVWMQRVKVCEGAPEELAAPFVVAEKSIAPEKRTTANDADDESDDGQLASLTRGVVDPSEEPEYEEVGDAQAMEQDLLSLERPCQEMVPRASFSLASKVEHANSSGISDEGRISQESKEALALDDATTSVRIWTLAKQLKLDSRALFHLCAQAGIVGKGSALARLNGKEIAMLRAFLRGSKRDQHLATSLEGVLSGDTSTGSEVRAKSACGRDLPAQFGSVQIVGFEGIGRDRVVLVEPVTPPTKAAQQLRETAENHGTVHVKVAEVVHGWGPPYLACHEVGTGLRTVLGDPDLSLDRSQWERKPHLSGHDLAETVPSGTVFETTVVRFGAADGRLRTTRLPQLLREWQNIKKSEVRNKNNKLVTAVRARIGGITGTYGNILTIVVDGGQVNTGLVFRFTQKVDRLLDAGVIATAEEAIQDTCLLLCVAPSHDQESLKLKGDLEGVGEGEDLGKMFRTIDAIEWVEASRTIQSKGKPIPASVRDKLLKLSSDPRWHDQVWEWWAKTIAIRATGVCAISSHIEGSSWLGSLKVGDRKRGRILEFKDRLAIVALDGGGKGALHVSEIGWQRVDCPQDSLSEGEYVEVMVKAIDKVRRRVQLSMKALQPRPRLRAGQVLQGRVSRIEPFGAFVDLGNYGSGLVHISEIANGYVADIRDYVCEDDEITVRVLDVKPDGKVNLSMRDVDTTG